MVVFKLKGKKGDKMNLSYFMSILDLYLSKEKEHKTNLSIVKFQSDKIKVNFTMNYNLEETTSFFVNYDSFMERENLCNLFKIYKEDLIVIDEKYEYDKLSETCYYCILLSNGRILSFKNFTLNEINKLRNYLYNIKYNPEEIKIVLDDNEHDGYYFKRFAYGQGGFASFLTLFIIIFALVNVFVITLWIFNNFL